MRARCARVVVVFGVSVEGGVGVSVGVVDGVVIGSLDTVLWAVAFGAASVLWLRAFLRAISLCGC